MRDVVRNMIRRTHTSTLQSPHNWIHFLTLNKKKRSQNQRHFLGGFCVTSGCYGMFRGWVNVACLGSFMNRASMTIHNFVRLIENHSDSMERGSCQAPSFFTGGLVGISMTRYNPLRCIFLWLLTITSLGLQEDWCRLVEPLVPKRGPEADPNTHLFAKNIYFWYQKRGHILGPILVTLLSYYECVTPKTGPLCGPAFGTKKLPGDREIWQPCSRKVETKVAERCTASAWVWGAM